MTRTIGSSAGTDDVADAGDNRGDNTGTNAVCLRGRLSVAPEEVVPGLVELEVAVPRLRPAEW